MPSVNLDLVRSILSGWERGDFASAHWAHPEIEMVWVGGPSPGSRTGLAEMAKGERDFLSAWEGYRTEAEEYRQLDDERVLGANPLQRKGQRKRTGGRADMDEVGEPVPHSRRQGDEARRLLGPRARARRPGPHAGHRHLTPPRQSRRPQP